MKLCAAPSLMTTRVIATFVTVSVALLCLWSVPALAHEATPGVLVLTAAPTEPNTEPNTEAHEAVLTAEFRPPALDGTALEVSWAGYGACARVADELHCDRSSEDVAGVEFVGLAPTRANMLARARADAATDDGRFVVVGARNPTFLFTPRALGEASSLEEVGTPYAATASGGLAGFVAWVVVGVEHIIFGYDHVLFVLALFLLIPCRRKLIVAATGFTVAHSVTLALSTLDIVRVSSAAVEATIALSIVLIAWEASRPERVTLSKRAPFILALIFGLVHGFGFAGVLADLPLSRDNIVFGLAGFNVGVELGQIGILLAAFGVTKLTEGVSPARKLQVRVALTVLIGAIGVFWVLERTVPLG